MIYFHSSVQNKFLSSFYNRPQGQELFGFLNLSVFSDAAIDLKLQSVVALPHGLLRPAAAD